jgi:hypothetical protein
LPTGQETYRNRSIHCWLDIKLAIVACHVDIPSFRRDIWSSEFSTPPRFTSHASLDPQKGAHVVDAHLAHWVCQSAKIVKAAARTMTCSFAPGPWKMQHRRMHTAVIHRKEERYDEALPQKHSTWAIPWVAKVKQRPREARPFMLCLRDLSSFSMFLASYSRRPRNAITSFSRARSRCLQWHLIATMAVWLLRTLSISIRWKSGTETACTIWILLWPAPILL